MFHQNQISPAVLGRRGDRLLPHVRQPASQVAGFIILLSSSISKVASIRTAVLGILDIAPMSDHAVNANVHHSDS